MATFASILNRELNAWHHLPGEFQEPRLVVISPHPLGAASLRALFPFLHEAVLVTDAAPSVDDESPRPATATATATATLAAQDTLPAAARCLHQAASDLSDADPGRRSTTIATSVSAVSPEASNAVELRVQRVAWHVPTAVATGCRVATPGAGPATPADAAARRRLRRRTATGLTPEARRDLRAGRYATAIFLLPHEAASGRMMLALHRAGVRTALFEEADGWHRMPIKRALLAKFRVQSIARRVAGGLIYLGRLVDERIVAPCINVLAGAAQRPSPFGSSAPTDPIRFGNHAAADPAMESTAGPSDPRDSFSIFIESDLQGPEDGPLISTALSTIDGRIERIGSGPSVRPPVAAWAGTGGNGSAHARALSSRSNAVPAAALPPLRVCQYISCLNSGGAERQLANLTKGLHDRGHHVRVLTQNPPEGARGHFLRALLERGIEVRQAGAAPEDGLLECVGRDPQIRLDLIRDLPAPLRDPVLDLFGELVLDRPDVLHCWLDHPNIIGGMAALAAGVPHIVLSTRNVNPTRFPDIHRPWMREWYRVLARSRRVHFIANSVIGADDYASWLDLTPDRFHVVRNGVDLGEIAHPANEAVESFRDSLGLRPGQPLIAGVFRLAPEKRPDIFVQVIDRVRRAVPDVVAVIAGIGPLQIEVQTLLHRLGIADRVHLLNRRHDIPVILQAADLMLLTSEHEGTPNCVLEALTLGRPVVATRAGGTADVLTDGVNGLVAPVNDVPKLAHDVVRVLRDPDLAESLGEAGRRHVQRVYGLDQMVDHSLAVYAHALRRPAAGGGLGLRLADGDDHAPPPEVRVRLHHLPSSTGAMAPAADVHPDERLVVAGGVRNGGATAREPSSDTAVGGAGNGNGHGHGNGRGTKPAVQPRKPGNGQAARASLPPRSEQVTLHADGAEGGGAPPAEASVVPVRRSPEQP